MHVGGETQIPTLDATWKLLWMQIDIILNEGVLSIYGHSWVLRTVVRNGSAYWYGHNWEKGRRNSFFPTSLRRVEKWQKVNTLLCMIIKHEINNKYINITSLMFLPYIAAGSLASKRVASKPMAPSSQFQIPQNGNSKLSQNFKPKVQKWVVLAWLAWLTMSSWQWPDQRLKSSWLNMSGPTVTPWGKMDGTGSLRALEKGWVGSGDWGSDPTCSLHVYMARKDL